MAPIEAAEYQRIIDFLKALDNKLNKRALLYLIGGGAITLAYAPKNRTADIILVLNFWIKVRLPIFTIALCFLKPSAYGSSAKPSMHWANRFLSRLPS